MKLFGLTNLCDLLDPEKEQKKKHFHYIIRKFNGYYQLLLLL